MGTNPKSKEFSAKASVLKELIEHHIREEEKQMFPQARKLTEHGVRPKKELPELEGLERSTQQPQTIELPVTTALPAAVIDDAA